jgi:hypothetical protein
LHPLKNWLKLTTVHHDNHTRPWFENPNMGWHSGLLSCTLNDSQDSTINTEGGQSLRKSWD